MQAEYHVPLKPQGEFGQADCNYLAWHQPRTSALAPFQNRLLTKAMRKRGRESGGQDLAVVPLMKDTTSVSPRPCAGAAPALSQGTITAPRAARAATAAPSVPQNSPRRAVAKPRPVTGGDALPPSLRGRCCNTSHCLSPKTWLRERESRFNYQDRYASQRRCPEGACTGEPGSLEQGEAGGDVAPGLRRKQGSAQQNRAGLWMETRPQLSFWRGDGTVLRLDPTGAGEGNPFAFGTWTVHQGWGERRGEGASRPISPGEKGWKGWKTAAARGEGAPAPRFISGHRFAYTPRLNDGRAEPWAAPALRSTPPQQRQAGGGGEGPHTYPRPGSVKGRG